MKEAREEKLAIRAKKKASGEVTETVPNKRAGGAGMHLKRTRIKFNTEEDEEGAEQNQRTQHSIGSEQEAVLVKKTPWREEQCKRQGEQEPIEQADNQGKKKKKKKNPAGEQTSMPLVTKQKKMQKPKAVEKVSIEAAKPEVITNDTEQPMKIERKKSDVVKEGSGVLKVKFFC